MLNFLKNYPSKYWKFYLAGILALLATNYVSTLIPRKIEAAIDVLRLETPTQSELGEIVASIILLSVCLLAIRTLSRILIFFPGRFVEFDLRNDLYSHLIGLSSTFFNKQKVGDLMSRLINDIQHLRLMVGFAFLNLGNTLILFPFALYQMAQINLKLTLLSVAPIPFIMCFILVIVKFYYRSVQKTQSLLGSLTDQAVQTFSGINTVKCYNAESAFNTEFEAVNQDFQKSSIDVAYYRSMMFPTLAVIGSIGNFVLFYFGSPMIVEGKLSIGQFTAFSAYIALLAWPTASMAYMISVYQRGKVAVERIQTVFSETPDIIDGDHTNHCLKLLSAPSIEFKDFSFRFSPTSPLLLEHLTFKLEAGQTLGIFGPTGSGKSLIADIISRRLAVDSGGVYINNEDITQWPVTEYRKAVSYVPQNSFLFSETIEKNISYANQTDIPDRDAVKAAARQAAVDKDISEFPKGYQTSTGEKGIVLSGGQKNRVALARAFFKPHNILVLDDVLSSVDHDTEKKLIEQIGSSKNSSTSTIIISHRVSALTRCEKIIVLEGGKITAQGSHDELILKDGIYRDTWRYQKLSEGEESNA